MTCQQSASLDVSIDPSTGNSAPNLERNLKKARNRWNTNTRNSCPETLFSRNTRTKLAALKSRIFWKGRQGSLQSTDEFILAVCLYACIQHVHRRMHVSKHMGICQNCSPCGKPYDADFGVWEPKRDPNLDNHPFLCTVMHLSLSFSLPPLASTIAPNPVIRLNLLFEHTWLLLWNINKMSYIPSCNTHETLAELCLITPSGYPNFVHLGFEDSHILHIDNIRKKSKSAQHVNRRCCCCTRDARLSLTSA